MRGRLAAVLAALFLFGLMPALVRGANEQADRKAWDEVRQRADALAKRDPKAAIALCREFFDAHKDLHPRVAVTVCDKLAGLYYTGLHDAKTSLELCDWGLQQYGADPWSSPDLVDAKARVLIAEKRFAEAEAACRSVWERLPEAYPPTASIVVQHLCGALDAQGQKEKIPDLLRQAMLGIPTLLDDSGQIPRGKVADAGWIYVRLNSLLQEAGKNEEALSWAKQRFMLCKFDREEIERGAAMLASVWMVQDGAGKAARAFSDAQTDPATRNPLAEVKLPPVDPELVKAQLARAQGGAATAVHVRINLLLRSGEFLQAMREARDLMLREPAKIEGAQEAARIFKAADLNLRRANQFIAFAKGGEGPNPLADFIKEHTAAPGPTGLFTVPSADVLARMADVRPARTQLVQTTAGGFRSIADPRGTPASALPAPVPEAHVIGGLGGALREQLALADAPLRQVPLAAAMVLGRRWEEEGSIGNPAGAWLDEVPGGTIRHSMLARRGIGLSPIPWDAAEQGRFIMSLALDGRGCLWAGTEEKGVWRYDPAAPEGQRWTQFTTKDGLGDEYAYALCCDRQGRVWVGHLNHGVSVFNGEKWRNYDVLDGPIGERVFALACSPADGEMWIATSAGVSRYSPAADTWSDLTRADGLPSDQVNAIAFDGKGTVWLGTQCDGIASSSAADGYRTWHRATCPGTPTQGTGEGLPSDLINSLLISRSGALFAATTAGLAVSGPPQPPGSGDGAAGSARWSYRRGHDYAAKVRGLYGGPPKGWLPRLDEDCLPEDHATCLAEDGGGRLWVGQRQEGLAVLDARTGKQVGGASREAGSLPDDYVTALLPVPGIGMAVGTYGGGLTVVPLATPGKISPAPARARRGRLAFPKPAAAWTAAELRAALTRTKACEEQLPPGTVVVLGEDWVTQGDWVGRYGNQYGVLSAAGGRFEHVWSHGEPYRADAGMGTPVPPGDGLRRWVHWLRTEDHRALYDPLLGYRRQADWDDHGEGYPQTRQGPDVSLSVRVLPGPHRVALYCVNKDGRSGLNRHRDYLIDVSTRRPTPPAGPGSPMLARCRVSAFWGGVYKSFLVCGPAELNFRIVRNHSYNTICSGVFIDRLRTSDLKRWDRDPLPWMGKVKYEPPDPGPARPDAGPCLAAAGELWAELESRVDRQGVYPVLRATRLRLYRVGVRSGAAPGLLANWRWRLPLWDASDRTAFDETMRLAWKSLIQEFPRLATVPH